MLPTLTSKLLSRSHELNLFVIITVPIVYCWPKSTLHQADASELVWVHDPASITVFLFPSTALFEPKLPNIDDCAVALPRATLTENQKLNDGIANRYEPLA